MNGWRWASLALVLFAAFLALNCGVHSFPEYRKLQKDEAMARARLDSLVGESDSLRAFRDSFVGNAAVRERVARERLGMIRPGEISVTIVRGDSVD